MRAPPTGTVTFLFTDIEGSTRLWQDQPDQMCLALARHDQLLHQAITQNVGSVFKTVGDAFCAAFATAPEALAGALAAQLALAAEPWPTKTPLLVRMALHTGSAEERDGDYYGPPLNRVARLLAAGHGGQTLISAAAQELVRDQLPAAAALRDLGDASLKDLSRPERVFQLLHPSLPIDFPPLKSLDNPALPNNLPQQPTSFVGREREAAEIKALLNKTRLLTLTGAGGSGKTRLSLQVAADLLDGEGDGVWLVELAALSDPALVSQAVAQVLGVKEQAGQPIQRTLVEALKPKRLLLVLDNCEHLVTACAALAADLLRACPSVHLLATSREPLNVAGEQTYRVPSMTLPDLNKSETKESLSQYEAVRLFIERGKAVQPSFAVTDINAPAVAQICFHLDGIPLAIELAAARVRTLPVEEINRRLDQRFRLLTGGARDTLPRQQTLRALIDWSYDLLTAQEKVLFCRLSVFTGGWTLDAAEAVCAGDGVEAWEVLDLLTALTDKSLVVYEAGNSGRYHLLETVRQYAGQRLTEKEGAGASREQHLAWCVALAEEAYPQIWGPEQGMWLSRLETEHDNLRAALDWGGTRSDRAEECLCMAGALWKFWDFRGYISEGRRRLESALRQMGAKEGTRIRALHGLGCAVSIQGELEAGRTYLAQVLAISRKIGDRRWEATGLNALGNTAMVQGELGAARDYIQQALAINREIGKRHGEGTNLFNLADIALAQGDLAGARSYSERALAVWREVGYRGSEAGGLNQLAELAFAEGDLAAARDYNEQALAISREIGSPNNEAMSIGHLGELALAEGEVAEARVCFERSLAFWRKVGDHLAESWSLNSLGRVGLAEGDLTAARNSLGQALAIRRRLPSPFIIASTLEEFAALARAEDALQRAVRLAGAAQAAREATSMVLPPEQRGTHEQTLTAARAALDDEAFSAAWDAGRAMTLEQAVEYALSAE